MKFRVTVHALSAALLFGAAGSAMAQQGWGAPPPPPANGPQWGAPPGQAAQPAASGPQWGPPPGGAPQAMPGGPLGGGMQPGNQVLAPQQPQQMPCQDQVVPLREAIERDGNVVKKSIESKQDRAIVCTNLKKFAATEAKFVKYLKTNAQQCQVPPQILAQLDKNHGHTLKLRGQACSTAPTAGRPPPAGSGLSEALGTARGAGPAPGNKGSTFSTLSGSAPTR